MAFGDSRYEVSSLYSTKNQYKNKCNRWQIRDEKKIKNITEKSHGAKTGLGSWFVLIAYSSGYRVRNWRFSIVKKKFSDWLIRIF